MYINSTAARVVCCVPYNNMLIGCTINNTHEINWKARRHAATKFIKKQMIIIIYYKSDILLEYVCVYV